MGLGENQKQKEVAAMYYTGIDLHKKTSFITTIDAGGKIVTRANLQNVEEDILAYFSTLREETKIVIESMKGGRSCFFAFLSGHGAWRLKEKKLHPLRFRRNGAPSTYRSASDCLLDGEGHPDSC